MDNNEKFKAIFESTITNLPYNEEVQELKRPPILKIGNEVFPVESMNSVVFLSMQYNYKWNTNVWVNMADVKEDLKDTVFTKSTTQYVSYHKYNGEEIGGRTAIYNVANEFNIKDSKQWIEKNNIAQQLAKIETEYVKNNLKEFIANANKVGLTSKTGIEKFMDSKSIVEHKKEMINFYMFLIHTYAGEKSFRAPYSKEIIEQERKEGRGAPSIEDYRKTYALFKMSIHKDMTFDITDQNKRTDWKENVHENTKKKNIEYER